MLDYSDLATIAALGSVGAFLSGFLGVGGGIIFIPVLDYYLSKAGMHDEILVKGILANSLFTIIFSGAVSSYKQYRLGNFFPREIIQTALPGVLTAVLITWLIQTGNWYSKSLFNYVFAGMLMVIMLRMLLRKSKAGDMPEHTGKDIQYNLTGFFAGMLTAFSGLGGGVVMTPVFTDVLHQPMRKASSISNGVIPFFAVAIGIYNLSSPAQLHLDIWHIGYIILPAVLPMIVATFIFAPIGVQLAQKTSQQTVRLIFATFVGLVFIKLVYEIFFAT